MVEIHRTISFERTEEFGKSAEDIVKRTITTEEDEYTIEAESTGEAIVTLQAIEREKR